MKNILIIGASGHTSMIVDILNKTKTYNIVGLLDSYKKIGTKIYGHSIIGRVEDIDALSIKHQIYGVIIGVGDNFTRKNLKEKIEQISPNIKFINAVHPSAILAEDIIINPGTVVMPGVIINANAKIGEFCILNTKSSLGHDCKMDSFASLASGVTIGGASTIGFCSAICLGASIIHNVDIGDHTVIGAGSLVLKSIGDYKQAFGIPVNTVKNRLEDSKYLG